MFLDKRLKYIDLKEKIHFKAAYTVLSTSFIAGLCFLLYGINETIIYVNKIVDPKVLLRKRNTEYIYINQPSLESELSDGWDPQFNLRTDEWMPSLLHWWERRKKLFIWRLLEVANSSDLNDRRRAVETLASYNNLHDYEYQQLAQACNAQTAVALARMKNVDKRFFLKPYQSNRTMSKQDLTDSMRNVLYKLCKSSRHACLNYFLSKMFPKFSSYKIWTYSSDLDSYGFVGTPPSTVSDDTILPLCIEALVHHSTVCGNVKAIVDSGALSVLFECYKTMNFDLDTCYQISKVLMELSTHPEFLQDFFQTGWVSVLAEWLSDSDSRLSIAAASSLINLDVTAPPEQKYGREVVLLHPTHSSREKVTTDVVLIHGLLGGVHYTWRQRGSKKEPISLFGDGFSLKNVLTDKWKTNLPAMPGNMRRGESLFECARATSFVIDEAPQEHKMGGLQNNDSLLESDYVFVMSDIPVSESLDCNTCCSFDGEDKKQLECIQNAEFTTCWPKDWLPKDCKSLRVVGVNYDTRITDWRHWCPLRDRGSQRILAERCRNLLNQLIECGIGERPVVWIAHSMGGLMLKHMLTQAWKSAEGNLAKICSNTKAIVFLSTPHIGSPWATLNEAWRIFFLPSTELDELRYKSPVLQMLHEEFLKFVEDYPIEIVSFVETKSMKISAFELEFLCVPPDTGDTGTGALYKIPLGHLDICKPDGKFSFIYQRILSLIRSIVNDQQNKDSIKSETASIF